MSDSDRSYNTDDNDDTMEEVIGFLPTTTAPDLYLTPTYFRQLTRQSKIVKVTTERYLREDLGFGCYYMDDDQNGDNKAVVVLSKSRRQHVDKILGQPRTIESVTQLLSLLTQPSSSLSSTSKTETLLLVVDTNVLLHNLDVLQNLMLMHRPVDGITIALVIPQTSLWECRARQIAAYDRTIELIRTVRGNDQRGISIFFPDLHHIDTANVDSSETSSHVSMSINDENDQRIRNVAEYFGVNLRTTNVRVILLTDDRASRVLANDKQNNNNNNKRINFRAQSVRAFVKELESKHPEMALSDLVAHFTEDAFSDDNAVDPLQQQHAFRFPPHVEANELARGIMTHMYYRGSFRRLDLEAAMVTIRREDERVAITIQGKIDCNRAVDGDVVAIALHPLTKWIPYDDASKATNHIDKVDSASTATASVGIANETADPSLAEENNVPESLTIDGAANWRPTGKVVGIIRRNFGNYSGSIYEIAKTMNDEAKRFNNLSAEREAIAAKYEREHADGSNTCVFFPVNDKKIPPVLIRTTQRDRLLRQRIVVCIDSWPADSPYPLGHYVRTIGPAGSKDVETQVLLHQHDIPHQPFSAAVLACLPPEDYKIDNDNSPGREDLRHLPVLSIDPPGCKDIDDALHCIQLPNGNYQVGVHIADVTHYVKTGTAIDLEAANRSTSTYLVNKRLDMLPGLLTTDLCSLKGNVDRYAFSVLWEVTADDVPEIVNVEFKKTIIHSIAALTYQQAQIMIESDDDPNDIQAAAVKRLASLARQFRKRRIEAGALTLASPEVKFVLDSESLNPTDVQAYAILEANAVVEEFMLLANVTVAKKILRHYPTLSVLRRHPAPNRQMFDSLISKAKSRGLAIDIEDSRRLADSLDAAQVESDPYINKLLRILSTRCMSPAQYFCSGEFRPQEWQHYGLAAPVYTHFTSPIRRYADVCVHRLLAAAIGVAPLPQLLSSKSYLHDLCANMNRRHRAAQLAGRDSVQLHTLIFFAGDGAKEEDAYVLDVNTAKSSEPFFNVIVPRYGIEGRVKLTMNPEDPNLCRMPDQHKMAYVRSDNTTVSVQVFDRVRVRVWVNEVQDHQRELVLDLLEPNFSCDGKTAEKKRKPLKNPAEKQEKKKPKQ